MTVKDLKKFLNELKDDDIEITLVVREKDKDCIVALTSVEFDKNINVIKIVPNDRISVK